MDLKNPQKFYFQMVKDAVVDIWKFKRRRK